MDVSIFFIFLLFIFTSLICDWSLFFPPCFFSTGRLILDTKPCKSVHFGWTAEQLWGEISFWCWEHMSFTCHLSLQTYIFDCLPTCHTFWSGLTAELESELCIRYFSVNYPIILLCLLFPLDVWYHISVKYTERVCVYTCGIRTDV